MPLLSSSETPALLPDCLQRKGKIFPVGGIQMMRPLAVLGAVQMGGQPLRSRRCQQYPAQPRPVGGDPRSRPDRDSQGAGGVRPACVADVCAIQHGHRYGGAHRAGQPLRVGAHDVGQREFWQVGISRLRTRGVSSYCRPGDVT